MIKVAIIDDEIIFLEKIENYLKLHSNFEAVYFHDPQAFLDETRNIQFDLLFLDIEMPNINGLEVLEKLQKSNYNCLVIFITNNEHYMLDCFNKNVIGFISKYDFDNHIDRCIKKANLLLSPLKIKFETFSAPIEIQDFEIIMIEIQLRKIYLCLSTGIKIQLKYKSIDEILNVLSTDTFFQVNRSTIINLEKVTQFLNLEITLSQIKQPIQLSKYRKKEFIASYCDFNLRRKNS